MGWFCILRLPGFSISSSGIELAMRPQFARPAPAAARFVPALGFIPIPMPLSDPAKFCSWLAFMGCSCRGRFRLDICFRGTEWIFLLTRSLVLGASRRPIDNPKSSGSANRAARYALVYRYYRKLFVVAGPAFTRPALPLATFPILWPLSCSTFLGVSPEAGGRPPPTLD